MQVRKDTAMKSSITLKVSGSPADIKRVKRIIRPIDQKHFKAVFHRLDLEYSVDEEINPEGPSKEKKISEAMKIINLINSSRKGGQSVN